MMQNLRDFSNANGACKALKNDVSKLLGFIAANLPEGKDWPAAGSLGHIREELLTIARFTTNSETTQEAAALVDDFKI
jgi:hypothetical protein